MSERKEIVCTVCAERAPMSTALVVMPSRLKPRGLGVGVLAATDIAPGFARYYGVCGIPCAVRKFSDELTGAMTGDIDCPGCGSLMPPEEGDVCLDCVEAGRTVEP